MWLSQGESLVRYFFVAHGHVESSSQSHASYFDDSELQQQSNDEVETCNQFLVVYLDQVYGVELSSNLVT